MSVTTTYFNRLSFFYAIGNTPAVNFAQDIPPEDNVDILSLGCGDIRNILFTLHSDTRTARSFDFTCCDYDAAILARNALILTLILDDQDGSKTSSLWNIYYHRFVDDKDLQLLQYQITRLLGHCGSIEDWHSGPYGQPLRFCDEPTFRCVRSIWQSHSNLGTAESSGKKGSSYLNAESKRANDVAKVFKPSDSVILSGLRSAAPLHLAAFGDITAAHRAF